MNHPRHTPAEAVQYWYDAATERREERDRLRAVVACVRQMADAWEQQLPEVIRTPAVVSALRAALEPAAAAVPQPKSRTTIVEGPQAVSHNANEPAMSAVVSPPTDRADLRGRIAAALRSLVIIGDTPPRQLVPVIDGSNPRMARIADWQPLDALVDAVLAVLGEPTDRAAVLREAIDVAREEGHRLEEAAGIEPARGARSVAYLLRKLLAKEGPRRMAVEAHGTGTQQPEAPVCGHVNPEGGERCGLEQGHDWHRCVVPLEVGETTVSWAPTEPAPVAQQQPDIGARAEEPPTEEQMVRDHVTTLHLIGEQLTRVEAWMWAHLADVRVAQAATATPVAQQPAAEVPGPWVVQKICCGRDDGTAEFATWEAADSFRETYIDSARVAGHERSAIVRRKDAAAAGQQAAAADGEETRQQAHAEGEHAFCGPECDAPRCTCADAGDGFVPLGHYRDCPLSDAPRP